MDGKGESTHEQAQRSLESNQEPGHYQHQREEVKALSNRVKELESNDSQLKEKIQKLERGVAGLIAQRGDCEETKKKISDLHCRFNGLRQNYTQQKRTIESLKLKISALQNESANSRSTKEAVKSLQNSVNELEQGYAAQKKEMMMLNQDIAGFIKLNRGDGKSSPKWVFQVNYEEDKRVNAQNSQELTELSGENETEEFGRNTPAYDEERVEKGNCPQPTIEELRQENRRLKEENCSLKKLVEIQMEENKDLREIVGEVLLKISSIESTLADVLKKGKDVEDTLREEYRLLKQENRMLKEKVNCLEQTSELHTRQIQELTELFTRQNQETGVNEHATEVARQTAVAAQRTANEGLEQGLQNRNNNRETHALAKDVQNYAIGLGERVDMLEDSREVTDGRVSRLEDDLHPNHAAASTPVNQGFQPNELSSSEDE